IFQEDAEKSTVIDLSKLYDRYQATEAWAGLGPQSGQHGELHEVIRRTKMMPLLDDLTPVDVPAPSTEDQRQITGVSREVCTNSRVQHVAKIKLADGSILNKQDVITLMQEGVIFYTIPSPGVPGYQAHLRTGLPVLMQVRTCPRCQQQVLQG